jgi:hypothetical protein
MSPTAEATCSATGSRAADRFTSIWERVSGTSFQPWAEIAGIVGFLDGLRDTLYPDRFVTEEALARAVAQYGSQP